MKKSTKNIFLRILSTLLLTFLLFLCIPFSAFADKYVIGANGTSKPYRNSKFYEALVALPTTGDNRTDLLAVALSQLGYQEGSADGEYSGLVSGNKNFTEYNRNMGDYGAGYGEVYEWCASFVAFCLLQSRCTTQNSINDWCRKHMGDSKYIWREVGCSRWAEQLRRFNYFRDSIQYGGNYVPTSGDLIFFAWKVGNSEAHIGIVLYCDGTNVYTIEGNTSDADGLVANGGGVYLKKYSLQSKYIRGYGVLPYKNDDSVYKIDYSGKTITPGTFTTATAKPVYDAVDSTKVIATLPRYTTFKVTDIAEGGRVKISATLDNTTVTGYVTNDSARIIQMTAAVDAPSIINLTPNSVTLEAHNNYEYKLNDNEWQTSAVFEGLDANTKYKFSQRYVDPVSKKATPQSDTAEFSISKTIESNKLLTLKFNNESVPDFDPDKLNYDLSFDISQETFAASATAPAGHNVTVGKPTVRKDSVEIQVTVSNMGLASTYVITARPNTPPAPVISSLTESSVTLEPQDSAEYMIEGGKWQKSNTFEGLDPNATYKFYQRYTNSGTHLSSAASEPTQTGISSLMGEVRLTSLTANGTAVKDFVADTFEYTIKYNKDNGAPTIEALAAEGCVVSVGEATQTEDGVFSIPVSVERYGHTVTYTVKAEPAMFGCGVSLAPSALIVAVIILLGTGISFKKNRKKETV